MNGLKPSNHQRLPIQTQVTPHLSIKSTNEFADMLRNRPKLTTPTFSFDLPKHGVLHRIPTTGFPVHCQARRLSPDTLLKLGIIRGSNRPYSSPLHVAPKPRGGWRPCGDYRRLNDSTELDHYPVLEYMILQQIWQEKRLFGRWTWFEVIIKSQSTQMMSKRQPL